MRDCVGSSAVPLTVRRGSAPLQSGVRDKTLGMFRPSLKCSVPRMNGFNPVPHYRHPTSAERQVFQSKKHWGAT